MLVNRIVEYVFFFGLMAIVGYLVWEILSPFVSALALASIIVTICYPLYKKIVRRMPNQNQTLGAFATTILVLLIVIFPLFFMTSALVNEAVSVYKILNNGQLGFEQSLHDFETMIGGYIPGFELNITEYLQQTASWLAGNLGAIFAGTASTIFLFFIAIIGSFYFFRDGKYFTKKLVAISPLPDDQDELILRRLASAVRSVATGTVLVALIQGFLTAFGLWLFGFERAILWGTIASFGALIPGVGTSIVFFPAIGYLLITGAYLKALGVFVWAALAVGLIDNLLGPYLMSRGNALHPFMILLAVLGGISLFGPIGFIVGPVIMSLFMVLLELYTIHISDYHSSEEYN
jgi:predicted PurR-regulated permease PerM